MSTIKLDDDSWFAQFKPVANPTGDSGYFVDDTCYMFETFGSDIEKVRQANPDCVWTMIDGESDDDCDCDCDCDCEVEDTTVITKGFQHVNVIGYFITQVPAESNRFYEISLDC